MKQLNIIILLLMLMPSAWSAGKILTFPEPGMESNYNWLTNNLRCQKCANQTLADSQSDLASDLRHRVYKLVLTGKSRDQVVDYLVLRFGDRVSYNPPFKISTALLWLSPFILLAIGLFIMIRTIHKRYVVAVSNERTLSDIERQHLDQLLGVPANKDSNNDSANAPTNQERQS